MSHIAWKEDLGRRTGIAAAERGYLVLRSDAMDMVASQVCFEETRRLGKPFIAAIIPRIHGRVEIVGIEGRVFSQYGRDAIQSHAEIALKGSRAKNRGVYIDRDTAEIAGVHLDRAHALCRDLARILANDLSYETANVIDFEAERQERRNQGDDVA